MALQQVTLDVPRQVEAKSGRPILVEPEPSLPLLATVRIARGDSPTHVVRHNPSAERAPG